MIKFKTGQNIKVAAGSLINTDVGILRAERILPRTFLPAPDGSLQRIRENTSKKEETAYKLTLKNGNSITLGEGTTVRTLNGWKRVDRLTTDDFVLHKLVSVLDREGGKEINWKSVYNSVAIPIQIPKRMSEDFALWLGMLCSRGRYSAGGGVGITTGNEEIGKIFDDLTLKLFEIPMDVVIGSKVPGANPYYHTFSENLGRFLRRFLGPINQTRRPPQQILEGSLNEQIAFIKGLSLDGFIDKKYLSYCYGISKPLAQFTALILRSMGYLVHESQTRTGTKKTKVYGAFASGYTDEKYLIKPLEEEKLAGLKKGKFMVKVPKKLYDMKIKTKHPSYSALRFIKQKRLAACFNETLDKLEVPYPKGYYYVKVRSVTVEKDALLNELETFTSKGIVINSLILGSTN